MTNNRFSHKGKLVAWILIIIAITFIHFGDLLFHDKAKNEAAPPSEEFIPVVISTRATPAPEPIITQTEESAEEMNQITTEIEQNTPKIIAPEVKTSTKIGHDLIIVHYLISKFLQNLDYSNEIEQLDSRFLPQDVSNVLEEMNDYRIKYLAPHDKTENAIKQTVMDRIIGHFIKIKKVSDKEIEQKQLYNQILKNLPIIEDYFYSLKSLDKTSNHD